MKPPPQDIARIGVREFRERLAEHLDGDQPLAITRHGRTIGHYIPAAPDEREDQIAALMRSAARMEEILAAHGVTEDELVEDFRRERAAWRRRKDRS